MVDSLCWLNRTKAHRAVFVCVLKRLLKRMALLPTCLLQRLSSISFAASSYLSKRINSSVFLNFNKPPSPRLKQILQSTLCTTSGFDSNQENCFFSCA